MEIFCIQNISLVTDRLSQKRAWRGKSSNGRLLNSLAGTTVLHKYPIFSFTISGLAFQNFQEGRITFKPTYKYDMETDVFDTSKKMRIPSYTVCLCLHFNLS